jgi:hypothetical protein
VKKTFFLLLFCYAFIFSINAQDIGIGDPEILSFRKKEWNVYGTIHTNGLGLGGRVGKQNSIHYKSGFDFEITYYRHIKEQRGKTSYQINDYENKSFVYGKLNNFFQTRIGYGFTRIINTKPYWGGMTTAYFLYGGASIGYSTPVYLLVIKFVDGNSYEIVEEKYNPALHDLSNIYSRAPFAKGLKEIKIHPGLYLKTGFTFDFSAEDATIMALDFGLALDAYYPPVEKMAYTHKQYLLFTGFITFHLGKRLTNYE